MTRKPVYWSPSTRTALAEAELEYPEESFAFQSMTFALHLGSELLGGPCLAIHLCGIQVHSEWH